MVKNGSFWFHFFLLELYTDIFPHHTVLSPVPNATKVQIWHVFCMNNSYNRELIMYDFTTLHSFFFCLSVYSFQSPLMALCLQPVPQVSSFLSALSINIHFLEYLGTRVASPNTHMHLNLGPRSLSLESCIKWYRITWASYWIMKLNHSAYILPTDNFPNSKFVTLFVFPSASLPTHALKSEIPWLFVTPACLCSPHPLNHSILSLVAEDVHISSLLSTSTAP